jgi:hypothetical protein
MGYLDLLLYLFHNHPFDILLQIVILIFTVRRIANNYLFTGFYHIGVLDAVVSESVLE